MIFLMGRFGFCLFVFESCHVWTWQSLRARRSPRRAGGRGRLFPRGWCSLSWQQPQESRNPFCSDQPMDVCSKPGGFSLRLCNFSFTQRSAFDYGKHFWLRQARNDEPEGFCQQELTYMWELWMFHKRASSRILKTKRCLSHQLKKTVK